MTTDTKPILAALLAASESFAAKPTPGPWKHGTPGRGRFCVYQDGGHGRGICVMSNTQKREAWETEKYGEHGDNLEADANAALITAAPDMLEALRALYEHCSMIHKHWGEGCNQQQAGAAIKAGLAAIAKAEGRAE